MKLIRTEIDGVMIVEPRLFKDERGYFFESFSLRDFARLMGEVKGSRDLWNGQFVQDNESASTYGVVRGLHFQKTPHSQAKLVRVVEGAVLDVAVDIRKNSPTFGKHIAIELTAENHLQLFIPKGFAHGFSVLSPRAVFQYKCDDYYTPETEGAIAWDDPDLGIDWKIPQKDIILSPKDSSHPRLKDAPWLFI